MRKIQKWMRKIPKLMRKIPKLMRKIPKWIQKLRMVNHITSHSKAIPLHPTVNTKKSQASLKISSIFLFNYAQKNHSSAKKNLQRITKGRNKN